MTQSNEGVNTRFSVKHKGEDVFVEVSPCSWMNPGYGLQIKVSLKEKATNAESIFELNKALDASKMHVSDMVAGAKSMIAVWLEKNGIEPLKNAQKDWAKQSVEWAKIEEENRKRQAEISKRKAADMQSKGYTHSILAWIHPEQGEDYQVEAFFEGMPSQIAITKVLKDSLVKDDYTIFKLSDVTGKPDKPGNAPSNSSEVVDSMQAKISSLFVELGEKDKSIEHYRDQWSDVCDENQGLINENQTLKEQLKKIQKEHSLLLSAAYWITEGGEFAHWVKDKMMPMAAAKELDELTELVVAARVDRDAKNTESERDDSNRPRGG